MKPSKLLVLSLLVFSGAAYSATFDLSVSWKTVVTDCSLCLASGAGQGTWDTTTNVIDFVGTENMHIDFEDENPILDGVITRHFTIDTDDLLYYYTNIACDDGGTNTLCSNNSSTYPPYLLGDRIFLLDPSQEQTAGFVWDGVRRIHTRLTGVQNRTFTFTLQPPAIPIPSTALLFSSAVMGLIGLGRKIVDK